MAFSDPFGLWPPGVHDDLIRRALGGRATGDQITFIQQASRNFDAGKDGEFGNTQTPGLSYMHSIRAPGQSVTGAKAETAAFVADMIAQGKAAAAGGHMGAALHDAAIAMHAQMDATSPAHTDSNGDPKVWRGMGPQSLGHLREDIVPPSAQQIEASNAALRSTWDQIFGGPK